MSGLTRRDCLGGVALIGAAGLLSGPALASGALQAMPRAEGTLTLVDNLPWYDMTGRCIPCPVPPRPTRLVGQGMADGLLPS